MKPIEDTSPRRRARVSGAFWMLMLLSGGLATYARRGLIVAGDAASTSAHILAHPNMYLLGYAGDVLVVASYLVVTALLYRIFEPVSRSGALAATFFGLAGCIIQGVATLFELAPLTVLGGAPYLRVFDPAQLQALAYMFLKLYTQTYAVALVFFGLYGVSIGWLAFRSTFLPRALGVAMAFAGASWLSFLSPSFGARYLPILMVCAAGEAVLFLWLLIKGVDDRRWMQRAIAAERRSYDASSLSSSPPA